MYINEQLHILHAMVAIAILSVICVHMLVKRELRHQIWAHRVISGGRQQLSDSTNADGIMGRRTPGDDSDAIGEPWINVTTGSYQIYLLSAFYDDR